MVHFATAVHDTAVVCSVVEQSAVVRSAAWRFVAAASHAAAVVHSAARVVGHSEDVTYCGGFSRLTPLMGVDWEVALPVG